MAVMADRASTIAVNRIGRRKKTEVVPSLLRGEKLAALSRELRVEAHRLAAWRDGFLAADDGLKCRTLPVTA